MSLRVGFTCGAWDLLHAGHVSFLRECKRNCDKLLVGLQVNPQIDRPTKNKPVESIVERQIQLRGCKYVDDIIVYETEADLVDILKVSKLDVRFVGDDYNAPNMKITGEDLVPIEFIPRRHNWSSSGLRKRIKES